MYGTKLSHSPETSLVQALSEPSINQTLTALNSETSPTFFDCLQSGKFALSISALVAGDLVPAVDFVVKMYRSIDQGESWQLVGSYAAATDIFVDCPLRSVLWKWVLTTAGAAPTQVRART